MPAEIVGLPMPGESLRGEKRMAETRGQLIAEPFETLRIEDVFEAGQFAIFAIAKVAMDGDHGFGCVE